jgi:imidazolonepropionase-like amidohydrolase
MKMNLRLAAIIILVAASSVFPQGNRKTILAGRLLNVVDGTVSKNVLIVVDDDRIVKIEPGSSRANYSDVIDLSAYTVLPGLIDCHTHLAYNSYDESIDYFQLPVPAFGIIAAQNAKKTLEAGFTSVRDVGTDFAADIAIRDAIKKGWTPGPRMYVSSSALTITGGHGSWDNWMAPHLELKEKPGATVDGVEAVRKQVRLHIKNKADLIKIYATGGFGTTGTVPGAASFTIEEMRVAVDEARKHGLKVAAHAHGAEGIKNAVIAGVDSIEHGTLLNSESIELMKNHNVFLVMDLLAGYYDLIESNKDFSDKDLGESNKELYARMERNLLAAYNGGVRIAFGTDASVFEHGQNARQFALMRKAGIEPIDIIRSATISAAELIGISKHAGSIEKGKWADIIAVKGDPLEDVSVLENVSFVMKGGKVLRNK